MKTSVKMKWHWIKKVLWKNTNCIGCDLFTALVTTALAVLLAPCQPIPHRAENVWGVSTAPREAPPPLNAPQGSTASWNDWVSPQETALKVWTALSKFNLEQIILNLDLSIILFLLNYFGSNIATSYKSELFYVQENIFLFFYFKWFNNNL